MKAIVYNGPRDVSVKNVPDAKIEKPTDALVRVTTTNICGSDLHMYEGRTSFETGRIFGHENMGEVIEVGAGVDRVKVGDRVCLPFNIGCGFCENCEKGLTGYCLTANPGSAGAAYGFAEMGSHEAVRPNCCACLMPISTACCCLKTPPSVKTTTSCSRIFSLPAGTPPNWRACCLVKASPFMAQARSG
ncbi:zinc-containing alcohol dehydrogenase superfamily protein [Pseudomonas syringae pv. actinidiae]|nr:zinc-containing alcohol dehydrogenase superfamily protein [Pseudomonas syringae pv. actinidiae]